MVESTSTLAAESAPGFCRVDEGGAIVTHGARGQSKYLRREIPGTIVEVVEVWLLPEQQLIQGRVANGGWISLQSIETERCLATLMDKAKKRVQEEMPHQGLCLHMSDASSGAMPPHE